jgi:hypothetical protein
VKNGSGAEAAEKLLSEVARLIYKRISRQVSGNRSPLAAANHKFRNETLVAAAVGRSAATPQLPCALAQRMVERWQCRAGRHNKMSAQAIQMLPVDRLEMTLARGFPGVLRVTMRLLSDGNLSRLEVFTFYFSRSRRSASVFWRGPLQPINHAQPNVPYPIVDPPEEPCDAHRRSAPERGWKASRPLHGTEALSV